LLFSDDQMLIGPGTDNIACVAPFRITDVRQRAACARYSGDLLECQYIQAWSASLLIIKSAFFSLICGI
jgi:hypothetical protein